MNFMIFAYEGPDPVVIAVLFVLAVLATICALCVQGLACLLDAMVNPPSPKVVTGMQCTLKRAARIAAQPEAREMMADRTKAIRAKIKKAQSKAVATKVYEEEGNAPPIQMVLWTLACMLWMCLLGSSGGSLGLGIFYGILSTICGGAAFWAGRRKHVIQYRSPEPDPSTYVD